MNFLKIYRNLAWILILFLGSSSIFAEDFSILVHEREIDITLNEKNETLDLRFISFSMEEKNPVVVSQKNHASSASKKLQTQKVISHFSTKAETSILESSSQNFPVTEIKKKSEHNQFTQIFGVGVLKKESFLVYSNLFPMQEKISHIFFARIGQKNLLLPDARTVFSKLEDVELLDDSTNQKTQISDLRERFIRANTLDFASSFCGSVDSDLQRRKRSILHEKQYTLLQKDICLISTISSHDGEISKAKMNFFSYDFSTLRRKLEVTIDLRERLQKDRLKFLSQTSLDFIKILPISMNLKRLDKSFCCVKSHFYSNGKIWGDQQSLSTNC